MFSKYLSKIKSFNKESEDLLTKLAIKTKEYYKITDDIYEQYVKSIGQYNHIINLSEYSKTQDNQRTASWLNKREGIITASDIPAVLNNNKYKSRKETLKIKTEPYKSFSNIFTEWGNKFEPVATQVYEHIFNVEVRDACLMIHPIYQFIGASCDGFVLDHAKKEAWALEIKCPYRRNPTESIPECYIDQLKTQMEVCKIDKGVFFDVKLRLYKTEEEFLKDTKHKYKGMIYGYYDRTKINAKGFWIEHFIYPPIADYLTQQAWCMKKINEIMTTNDVHDDENFIGSQYATNKYYYWRVEDIKINVISRDREWLYGNLDAIEGFWNEMIDKRVENGMV